MDVKRIQLDEDHIYCKQDYGMLLFIQVPS